MPQFKEGDEVRHKVTMRKGTLWEKSSTAVNHWTVEWEDGLVTSTAESELISEEEYKKYVNK